MSLLTVLPHLIHLGSTSHLQYILYSLLLPITNKLISYNKPAKEKAQKDQDKEVDTNGIKSMLEKWEYHFHWLQCFNTILHAILTDKLEHTGVNHHFIIWILDYQLCDDPRLCDKQHTEHFSLQYLPSRLLPPLNHPLLTEGLWWFSNSQHYYWWGWQEVKGIQNFANWCQWSHLNISIKKTTELVIDFHRHKRTPLIPVNLQGMDTVTMDTWVFTLTIN